MADLHNRRQFLQLAGTGAAASLAGCSALGIGQDDSGDDADGPEAEDIPELAVTAALEPDPEAMEELEADFNQRIEDGELSDEEAGAEYQEQQVELLTDAVTGFESYADEHEITVHDSIPEFGAVLVEGDGDALATALNEGEISSLLPSETFVMAHQQQMIQEAQPEEEDGEDEIEAGEDDESGEDDTSDDDADDEDEEETDDGSDDDAVDEDSDNGEDADDEESSSDDGGDVDDEDSSDDEPADDEGDDGDDSET